MHLSIKVNIRIRPPKNDFKLGEWTISDEIPLSRSFKYICISKQQCRNFLKRTIFLN